MNHLFRSIWSASHGCFVAVSENTKTSGKRASRAATVGTALVLKTLALSVSLAFAPAHAAPVNGVVVAGNATITGAPGNLTIQQGSQNVALNWQSFNIAKGESVSFVQPNSNAVALNRVLGADPSSILGSLSANGKVFLVNPNGILFGRDASVNVGGLVASTLNLSDSDFMAGRYRFAGNGSGSVLNQGSIRADGGYVALLGANVSNQGTIAARLGTVALAAGKAITLDVAGDGFIKVAVEQGALNALVENGGLIQADGGRVLLSAQAAGELLHTAVNNSGIVQAQTIEEHEGSIRLLGDMQSGTVNAGGSLDASAPRGGNGGFIETSAAHVAIAANFRANSSAVRGRTGTWLIDPVDFSIDAGDGAQTSSGIGANTLANNLAGNSIQILTDGGTSGNGDIFVNSPLSWSANKLTLTAHRNININAPIDASGSASLALEYGQGAAASGNTSVVNVYAKVNLPAGTNSFSTRLGNDGLVKNYTVITSLGSAGSTTASDLQGMNGNLNTNYALGGDIDASATAGWNSGAGFDRVGKMTAYNDWPNLYRGTFDGLGHVISNLTINRPGTNYVAMFGGLDGNAMVKNIGLVNANVTGGSIVGALVGFNFGPVSNTYSTGTIKGRDMVGGLVGYNSNGFVLKSYSSAGVSTTSNTYNTSFGGLVGTNYQGYIGDSYATGSVQGSVAGGLVGLNNVGIVERSYATGAVSGQKAAGGLVADQVRNGNVVTDSYWNIETTGQGGSAGGTGLSSAQMQQKSNFANWDQANTWVVYDGHSNPLLRGLMRPLMVTVSNASKTYDGVAYSGGINASYSTTPDANLFGTLSYGNADLTNAGSYQVGGLYSTSQLSGYAINYVGGTVVVNRAPLTITSANVSKSYDGSLAAAGSVIVTAGTLYRDDSLSGGSFAFTDKNAGSNKAVSTSGVTIADRNGGGNYNISYVDNVNSTIIPAVLTASLSAANKAYDGDTSAATTLSIASGLVGSETVTASAGATFNSKDVTNANLVTVNSISLANGTNGGLASNYSLAAGQTASANILAKALTANATAANKTYDGDTSAVAGLTIASGLVGSETLLVSGSATFNSKDVASANLVTFSSTSLANGSNGGLASNYSLASGQSVAAAIIAKALTASVAAPNKTYDGDASATPSLTITGGFVGSETVTATGSATFNSKDVANANLVTVNSTSLANGSNGGLASNYTLASGQTVAASIIAKALTASVTAPNKTYDGDASAAPSLTIIGGFVGSETVNATGSATFNSKDVANANLVTVNSTSLANGSNGGLASNYSLASGQSVGANIIAKALTASVTAPNKTYDGDASAAPSLTISSGLVGSETLVASGAATFNSKNVADANLVTVNSISLANGTNGGLASNYTLASGQTVAASIIAKVLTASVTAPNKTYDGDASAAPVMSITGGLVGSETVTASGLATFNSKDVANANLVTVNSTSLANGGNGGLASNYSLTGGQTVAAAIIAKTLTASVTAPNKTYDGDASAAPVLTISGGLVGSETLTATGNATFNSKDVASANLVTVNNTSLADGTLGGLASNYSLVSGQTVAANIIAKALTASVTAPNKTYDGNATAAATLAIGSGLVGNETVSASGLATFNSKDVANANLVTVNSISLADGSNGGLASNYSLAAGQTVGAHIVAKALTAGVTAPNKTYDGNASAAASLAITGGLVGNETIGVSGAATFNSKDVANANLVTVNSTSLADGSNGGLASNYSLVSGQTVAANILAKALTASVTAPNKTYDGNTSAAAILAINSGLVGNETLTASGSATFNSKDVANANLVTVNSISLADGSNGGLASNYSLVSGQTVAANILAKALTASVTAPNKTYDGNSTSAAILAINNGLVGSETLTANGSATFNSKDVANANLVTVNSTTLADGANGGLASNYSLAAGQTVGAHIVAKALTAGVTAPNKTYDGNASAAASLAITGGLVGNETVGVSGAATFNSKDVATAKLVTVNSNTLADGSNGGLASNYSLVSGQTVAATILAKALTASASAPNKTYDGNNTATAILAINSGLVGNETVSASASASFNSKDVAKANLVTVNSSVLSDGANGGLASNYSLASGQTAAATIAAKTLTASVSAPNKTYDGNTSAAAVLVINSGLVSDETIGASASASFNSKDVANARLVTVNGIKLADGSKGGLASNYSLASGQTVAATILARDLTASATATGKTYDGNANAAARLAITGGLVGSETVGASGSASFNSKDVLTANLVTVNGTALSDGANGGLASNYRLASGQTVAAAIAAKDLTISGMTAASKVYDGNAIATLSGGTLNGLVGSETLALGARSASFADKNVGTAKAVTVNGLALADGTGLASNYRVAAPSGLLASITRLAAVGWVGGPSGNWFDPANWAGGAVPDLANVARVLIPAGVTVNFSNGSAQLDAIGSGGSLSLASGSLTVADRVELAGIRQSGGALSSGTVKVGSFEQSGGTFVSSGDVSVTNAFQQSGSAGQVKSAGNVDIVQAAGSVSLGNLSSAGTLAVSALDGNITQQAGTNLASAGTSTLTAPNGQVALASNGNHLATVIIEENPAPALAAVRLQDALAAAVSVPVVATKPVSTATSAAPLAITLRRPPASSPAAVLLAGLNVTLLADGLRLPPGVQAENATEEKK